MLTLPKFVFVVIRLGATYKMAFSREKCKEIGNVCRVPDIANYSTQSGRSGGRWKTKKVKNMHVKDCLKAKLDVSKALSC